MSERQQAVEVKALLVDPASMQVVWMNEAALAGVLGAESLALPADVERAFPMADKLGLRAALDAAAASSTAQHLQANLVSTNKGSMAIVTSVYRLPDGMLLVLTDQSWQVKHKADEASHAPRRPRRH